MVKAVLEAGHFLIDNDSIKKKVIVTKRNEEKRPQVDQNQPKIADNFSKNRK